MFAKTILLSALAALASTSVVTPANSTSSSTAVAVPATTSSSSITILMPAATYNPKVNTFIGIATHSGNADVHLHPINANGSFFYLSRDSSSYCPAGINGLDCSHFPGNGTVFAYDPERQILGLSVSLAGGQQVFVKADGSLSYTVPHSGFIPLGSSVSPFQYEPQAVDKVGKLRFLEEDFYACPPADSGMGLQIYAAAVKQNTDGKCIGLDFITLSATGTSYEY